MTVNFNLGGQNRLGLGWARQTSGSRGNSSTLLNTAFVYGVSGGCIGVRIQALKASAIKKFYMLVDAVTGTAANVVIKAEIRNEFTTATQPGTTVRSAAVTGTWTTTGLPHWVEFDFSAVQYTPATGETLWICIRNDAVAPGTDYPQILTTTGLLEPPSGVTPSNMTLLTSTNGFSTAGTVSANRIGVIEYADGTIDGYPFTNFTSTFYTSNQLERGIVIDPLDAPLWINAFSFVAVTATSIKIYNPGTQAPGTAIVQGVNGWQFNLGTDANQVKDITIGSKIIDPIMLPALTKFRVVYTYGSNSQSPPIIRIESATDFADLLLCGMFGNAVGYSTIDNGAGGWTDDKSVWGGIGIQIAKFGLPVVGRSVNVSSIGTH